MENTIELINFLHEYAIFTGDDDYDVYDRAYGDLFNVFTREDETERSVDISVSSLSFECYTDDVENDNWTYLTPNRVKESLRMMVAYVFLHEDRKQVFDSLHSGVQEKDNMMTVE